MLQTVIGLINHIFYHIVYLTQGYVTLKDMSTEKVEDPSSMFYVGQIIRCRVVHYNIDEKKLKLSFNVSIK